VPPSMNLVRLYAGAGLTPAASRSIGAGTAEIGAASYQRRRRELLVQALASGKIQQSQLGRQDSNVLGITQPGSLNRQVPIQGGLHAITGLLGNLGKDVFNAGKYFVPSLWETGRAAVADIFHMQTPGLSLDPSTGGLKQGGHSELQSRVVKPTLQNYAQMYGPAFQGNLGLTLRRMYQHPLQPILDVATVGSLGLGGAARVGGFAARTLPEGSRLAELGQRATRLTSTEGRAPIPIGDNELAREYSRSPLRRLSQQAYDAAARNIDPIGSYQARRTMQLDLRRQGSLERATAAEGMQTGIHQLGPALRKLDEPETVALNMALRGVNTPERLATWQESVRKTLRNEHEGEDVGKNIEHYEDLGVDPTYIERRLRLTESPQFQEALFNPTPNMVRAADLWKQNVQRGHTQLEMDPETHQTAMENRRALIGGEDPEDYPIAPDYAPDILAKGFRVEPQGAIRRAFGHVTGKPTGPERTVVEQGTMDPRAVTAQNLLSGRSRTYMHDSSGATFMAGVFRTDGRALLDHIARRERDVVEEAFNQDLINKYAMKDAEGNRREFPAGEQAPKGWKLVHENFPIQWFHSEINMLEGTLQRVESLRQQGFDEFSPEAEQLLTQWQDSHADAFIRSQFGAMRRPALAIPRDVFDYQMKIATVNDPYRIAGFNYMAKWMHRWRTLTLAYMPRWALNTAVGSFLMAMIKGVVRPGDYLTANKLARTFRDQHGNIIRKPSMLTPWNKDDAVIRGAMDETGAPMPRGDLLEPILPAGIDLKSVALQDYLEPGMIGADYADIGSRPLSRRIVDLVQSSEDFFRRAHFVQNLRGEAKQLMMDRGQDMKQFYRELGDKPMVEQWLEDPNLVRRAQEMTDKWSYSYGELGPMERRYLRQVIPFWGWYKFITKFVWRMGVDNPARAQMLNQLSQIGKDTEHQLGLVPPWVRGSILLNLEGGKLHYLSTAGLNPLANFANPLMPEGATSLLTTGQFSPLIQASLSAMGIDTLRGGNVPISPQEGVGPGIFGQPTDLRTGQQVNLATRGAGRRFIMSLLRSVPEFRTAEQYGMGGTPYPESVPFIAPRPMAHDQQESYSSTVVMPALGANINELDLKGYQELARKQRKYARTLAARNRKKIARSGR
jgi:hypothetical protein